MFVAIAEMSGNVMMCCWGRDGSTGGD